MKNKLRAARYLLLAIPCLAHAAGTTQMPFVSFFADDFSTGNGASIVTADATRPNLVLESIQHKYAKLDAQLDYVEITVPSSTAYFTAPINRVTVRYSVKFNYGGNHGSSWTLAIFADSGGTFHKVGTLTLSAKYIHALAGPPDNLFQPAPNPTAESALQRWWEEASATLTENVPAGSKIRIRKSPGDLADDYYIDAIDLEQAPAPLIMPNGAKNIVDYGAQASVGFDNAPAIRSAIAAAGINGKVWIPAATVPYEIHGIIEITSANEGVQISGAGVWHSRLLRKAVQIPETSLPWHTFRLRADANKVVVHDLTLDHDFAGRRRDADHGAGHYFFSIGESPAPAELQLYNMWFQRGSTPLWWDGSDASVHNNRAHNCYADGFHMQDGAANNVVTQNHIRGGGDDGLPQVVPFSTLGNGNDFISNTIEGNYFGRGVALMGGADTDIVDNKIVGGSVSNCILIRPYFMSTAGDPVVNAVVTGNLFDRCGNDSAVNISTNFAVGNDIGSPRQVGVTMNNNQFTNWPNASATGGVYLQGGISHYMKITATGNSPWPPLENDKAHNGDDSFGGQFQ